MSRIRSLKPDFFEDEDLAELDFWIRLLYEGLWCHADREGRLEDRPLKIKIQVFPYDKVDIEKGLSTLAEPKKHSPKNEPFIIRYSIDGCNYIQIIKFTKHQSPHNTERISCIPQFNGYLTVKQPLLNGSLTEVGEMHTNLNPNPNPNPNLSQNSNNLKTIKDTEIIVGLEGGTVEQVIDYLNLKSGKQYSPKTKATRVHISARIAEGRTIQDFKRVIDIKVSRWKDDPKMEMFLRPETLFGNKFEGYLNERKKQTLEEAGEEWIKNLEEKERKEREDKENDKNRI